MSLNYVSVNQGQDQPIEHYTEVNLSRLSTPQQALQPLRGKAWEF